MNYVLIPDRLWFPFKKNFSSMSTHNFFKIYVRVLCHLKNHSSYDVRCEQYTNCAFQWNTDLKTSSLILISLTHILVKPVTYNGQAGQIKMTA